MDSIEAAFQFKSYKIDHVEYSMERSVSLLAFVGFLDPRNLNIALSIREPIFITSQKCYIGGLDTDIKVLPKPVDSPENVQVGPKPLLHIVMGIAGVFTCEAGRYEKDTEMRLVKIQIPAILFPYLRQALSSFLSAAGFGSVVLPLINVHEAAKNATKDLSIRVIE